MYRWGEEHEKEQKPKIAHEGIVDSGVKDNDKGDDGGEDELVYENTIDLADRRGSNLSIASP